MARHDPAWLDRMYNNRARVADSARHLDLWPHASLDARTALGADLARTDLRYGSGESETLDVFPALTAQLPGAPKAPVLVFIHGGWWRSLDKSDHSFIAPAFLRSGACVVVPNYALCPGTPGEPVTLPQIVMQMVRALAWVWRNAAQFGGDPKRITVAGHSAGGQLAAMLLLCCWKQVAHDLPPRLVRNALSISGLHDLSPIQRTPFLQPSLKLTPAQVRQASPALLPAPKGTPLWAVAGGEESEEFLRQTQLIRNAWGEEAVPIAMALPGLNHFSMVEALAQPGHTLHGMALALLHD